MDTKVYFKGFKEVIIDYIKKAKSSIKICMSWLSDEDIILLLQQKIYEIEVEIIMGYNLLSETNKSLHIFALSNNKELLKGTIFLKIYNPEHNNIRMHNKYCIIDNEIVLTGSLNWTHYGLNYNDENLIVILDPEIAKKYNKDFQSHFSNTTAYIFDEDLSSLKKEFTYPDDFGLPEFKGSLPSGLLYTSFKKLTINFKDEFIGFHTYTIKYMSKENRKVLFKNIDKNLKNNKQNAAFEDDLPF